MVPARQIYNFFEVFQWIYHTRWIIRVDDQNSYNVRIILDVIFQLIQVWIPMIFRIQAVGNRSCVGVGRFGGTVCAVGGRRPNDTAGHGEKSVNSCNGISKSVEEQNVICCNLSSAQFIGLCGKEFARREHAF